jgi:hypothetical protein
MGPVLLVVGLWIGLSNGVTVVACRMSGRWRRREALRLLLFQPIL